MIAAERDLLARAARAAGIPLYWANLDGVSPRHATTWATWNPLNDDGDALRLAVALDIELYQADNDGPAIFAGYWSKRGRRDVTRFYCIEPLAANACSATRLAIVRAAAAMASDLTEGKSE